MSQILALFLLLLPHITAETVENNCSEPRQRGNFCEKPQSQKFYFTSQGVCQPFMFNGCNGNGNRFDSLAQCQDFCLKGLGAQKMRDNRNDTTDSFKMKEACSADYDTGHLIPTRCNSSQPCTLGYTCKESFCCPSAEYICNLNYDTGKFAVGGVKSDKYFWNQEFNVCMRFSFYGTLGNVNNFPDYNSCMRVCGKFQKHN
ncbi:unnamed protein product [Auanema sp. JU1783]|nr:unnamed protein product [Auanema sp. JU1783]